MPNIPIVMYHSINDHGDESPLGRLAFSTKQFRQHLRFFRNDGFTCITLDELYQRAMARELDKAKYAVLTFDDGFLDNFTVAADVMREFGAKGTVFVNPDQTAEIQPDRSQCRGQWGRLTYPELIAMEKDGVFSIQSHTLTHDFAFSSNKVIDFYCPENHKQYYWLGCLLFPQEKTNWIEKLAEHRDSIPSGYPIFEFGRTLTTRKFQPDEGFVQRCIEHYSRQGRDGLLHANRDTCTKGSFETENEYRSRARNIICAAKDILESKLQKRINSLCFPGGGYNDYALECARECGHELYIFSSRDRGDKDNYKRLTTMNANDFVGLRRMSFTSEHPGFLRNDLFEYVNCKWHVDLFMDKPYAGPAMKVAKKVKSLLKLW